MQRQIDNLTLCLVLMLVLLATGCATTDEQMRMAIAAQQNVKPTLKVTCPAGGCEVEYTDARDRGNIKLPTNGWDFATRVVDVGGGIVQGAIVPAAFAVTAIKGMEAMKGHGTTTNTATTSTTTNTSDSGNTTTHTLSGTGVVGTGSYATSTTNTTTTDNHSQTATPTIVNPVVVNPVVVRP